jgi:hypothetical protein
MQALLNNELVFSRNNGANLWSSLYTKQGCTAYIFIYLFIYLCSTIIIQIYIGWVQLI